VLFLFSTSMAFGAGAFASRVLRGREISAIVAFTIVLTCVDLYSLSVVIRSFRRLAAHINVLRVSEQMLLFWFLAIVFYSLGCLWIRWHRVS